MTREHYCEGCHERMPCACRGIDPVSPTHWCSWGLAIGAMFGLASALWMLR